MNKQALSVFIIDDDPSARLMVQFQFVDTDDRTTEFDDGYSCLAEGIPPPDMVVLDVEMPGIDGISVCRALRDAGHNDTHVLFVSARDDLETRLSAYDAGGDDYIVKPFSPEELGRKISRARQAIEQRRNVAGQAHYAQEAAFTAMSSMSEMGITLDFLRRSYACQTPAELADMVSSAIAQYNCSGLVCLGDGKEFHYSGPNGECTDLERSLLSHAKGMERIFQFGNRLAINYPHTTFLIPNLPIPDPALVGRLRDHLAVLAEGTEARYLSMCNDKQRLRQAEEVIAAVAELARTLEDIDHSQESHRIQLMTIAHQQLIGLTNAFVHLGLSERQEESLVALTQSGINEISNLQDYGLEMRSNLRSVISRLRTVVSLSGPASTAPNGVALSG